MVSGGVLHKKPGAATPSGGAEAGDGGPMVSGGVLRKKPGTSPGAGRGAGRKGVRFEAGATPEGKSHGVASRALVPAAPARTAGGKGSRATAGGAGSAPAPEGGGVVDLDEAGRLRAARLEAGAATAQPQVGTRLVAYDHSTPRLEAGPLGKVCGRQLHAWWRGQMSGDLACLHVDDWAQGEVTWTDAQPGALQRRIGVVAGMLADASLERSFAQDLQGAVFAHAPVQIGCAAARKVLEFVQAQEAETILVSEVEHALTRFDSFAYGEGPAKRLEVAVHRELLRFLWTDTSEELGESQLNDKWLLEEIARTPQAAFEKAKAAPGAQLRHENQWLDSYLVRLLKLKRALVALLDEWEKVDHYAIIGVPPTASDKELRNAYRKACLRLHPDKGGDKAQFQQLQDAYAKILEERSHQPKTDPGKSQAKGTGTPGEPKQGAQASGAAAAAPGQGAEPLALEGPEAPAAEPGGGGPAPPEIEEVAAAERELRERSEASQRSVAEAESAEARVQELKQAKGGGVEALRSAQEAGETLMTLAEQLGQRGPQLSEAAMEVAEASLACAARFASVPAAMLLTDVAMSCTFEASRMKHNAHQLLEVHRDTVSTLMTLQTNLSMAKIIGNVDDETLRLSLGLVSKAATRIIAALRQVGSALEGALQRGRQCVAQAGAVAAFAAGRARADADAAEDDVAQAALPAPEGCTWHAPPPADGASEQPDGAGPESAGPPPGPRPGARPTAPAAPGHGGTAALEARLQNDKLLRQLNAELAELQRRARAHLAKRGGVQALAEVSVEARARALSLAAEALEAATDAAVSELAPGANVGGPAEVLARHLGFVESAGSALASPCDLRAQVLRLAVLLDTQAVLNALQRQARPRLVSRCEALAPEERGPALAAVERYFESLSNALVTARMS